MARVLSGIQPTGVPHLGNYVGAIARWSAEQAPEHFFCVVDLHSITLPHDPQELRDQTLELATWLLAAGLDPDVCTLFVQSQVPEHTQLSWVLESVATYGEVHRMTQFKDKSEGRDSVSVGLLTYPVLQAADILLYQAEEVPVGEDQRQHIELTRDIAQRFNHRYGDTFTVPKATVPNSGARVMDLQLVDKKMSKSLPPAGTVILGESEDETRRKIMRSVTDSGSEIRADPERKPGVTNLLDMFSAVTGRPVADIEQHFAGAGYGDFKSELAEAVNGFLRPVRDRYADLAADRTGVAKALAKGRDKARAVACETVAAVWERVGFLR